MSMVFVKQMVANRFKNFYNLYVNFLFDAKGKVLDTSGKNKGIPGRFKDNFNADINKIITNSVKTKQAVNV